MIFCSLVMGGHGRGKDGGLRGDVGEEESECVMERELVAVVDGERGVDVCCEGCAWVIHQVRREVSEYTILLHQWICVGSQLIKEEVEKENSCSKNLT